MIGIQVAETDIDGKHSYDSVRPRLQVAMDRNPKHLDIVRVTGSALQVFAAGAHTATETLATIRHELGYKPRVLCYFYQSSIRGYNVGRYYYAFGVVDDYLTYTVDENYLYIVHKVVDNFNASDFTSGAVTTGQIAVKYLLFSNRVDSYTNLAITS